MLKRAPESRKYRLTILGFLLLLLLLFPLLLVVLSSFQPTPDF